MRAQSVELYSEFQRIDPFGNVVAADRAVAPREILSPGLARNGYAAFHVAVSVPRNENYFLYVIPNPITACRVNLYKEHFVKTAQGWIPDTLTELTRLPDFGVMPDPEDHVEGQTTRLYLLELWLPPNADVARFRLEVQLKMGNWIVRPMEGRVLAARVPDLRTGAPNRPLPKIELGADAAVLDVMADYLSGAAISVDPHPLTVRGIIRRDAAQDVALAATLDPAIGGPLAIARRLLDLFRINAGFTPRVFGAEWCLKVRDFIFNQVK